MSNLREKSFGYPEFDVSGEKWIMDHAGAY